MDITRALALVGAVAVGLSQIFFGIVLANRSHFPAHGAFHAWTLLWVFAIPAAAVAGLDILFTRTGGRRLWRALLFSAVLVSFLRQIQSAYPEAFAPWLGRTPGLLLLALLAGLWIAVAWRWPEGAWRYLAALGALGLWLTGAYVIKTGVWGPAWAAEEVAAAKERSAPPFYVLVFDELAGDILLDGDRPRAEYPNFARLAADSAVFTDATSNQHWTEDAIPCLLTGRRRPASGSPSFLDLLSERREVLLFDNALMADAWVRRDGGRRVYSRGKAHYLALSPAASLRYLFQAAAQSSFARASLGDDRALGLPPPGAWGDGDGHDWIEREIDLLLGSVSRETARGRVTYWHVLLPHAPFLFDREGRPHGRRETKFYPGVPGVPGHDPARVLENYREQVGFADTILGRFLDRLRAEGLYEEAVVVVTSDHGLRTWYGDFQPPTYPEAQSGLGIRVPLLVKAPGLKPGPRDVDVQQIDVAPTLLRLAGVDVDPALFEGRDALAGGPPRRKLFFNKTLAYERDASGLWKRLNSSPLPK